MLIVRLLIITPLDPLLLVAAMLLGLNIFREVASSPNEVHYAVYTTSATVGLVLMLIALYNIYNISYHKGDMD